LGICGTERARFWILTDYVALAFVPSCNGRQEPTCGRICGSTLITALRNSKGRFAPTRWVDRDVGGGRVLEALRFPDGAVWPLRVTVMPLGEISRIQFQRLVGDAVATTTASSGC